VKTHRTVRGGRLRIALLAAFIVMTGTAYASTAPDTQQPGSGGTAAGAVQPGPARIHASVTRHVRRGSAVRVGGALRPAQGGRRLRIEVRSRGRWRRVGRARTGRGGRFRAKWQPGAAGRYRLRVRLSGRGPAAAASGPSRRVHVYRPGAASWYGPGLYGNGTSCGGSLTPGRLGVAHKTLPCGTRVTFRYGSRSVTVPVIDRGPFGGGREWDLTAATKQRLGFGSTGTVWTTE
jgi:rare lipoprotein A